MDSNQRPVATTYYPSPPSQDDQSPNSRTYPAAMPYPPRDAMPPPTPISSTTAVVNGTTSIPSSHPVTTSVNASTDKNAAGPVKQNRLSKACDGCSVRKVKCDEEGPPCRACRSLQIPCTFNRPSRRRGPPNRHAEAIKKQKLDLDASHADDVKPNGSPAVWDASPTTAFSSPIAFTHGFSQSKTPTAETICPFELIALLVDDFFVYMHPLHPFPHEPSFRRALLQERQDTRDPRFLALLASMIGALVATYPRRPLKRLKDLQRKHLFRSSVDFVSRCRDIAVESRGPGLFGRRDIGVVDAATSYFLGHMATNSMSVSEGELYWGECFNILRAMGYQRYHAEDDHSSKHPTELGQAPSTPQHADIIEREIAYRIYWALYIVVRSAFTFAFGSGVADIHFNPSTPLRRHPPLPAEVDDRQILPDRIEPQLHQAAHPLSAFNAICKMHMAYEPIKAWKLSWAVDERLDRDKQNSLYLRCIRNAETALEANLPGEFRVGPPPPPTQPGSPIPGKLWEQQQQGSASGSILSPSVGSAPHFPSAGATATTPSTSTAFDETAPRRKIGIEIQKANVHVTFLTACSFYLEKYWNSNGMVASVIGMTPDQVASERLSLARRMLSVLCQVHPVHMEPNSFAFCMKIRQVASTLYAAAAAASLQHGNGNPEHQQQREDDQRSGKEPSDDPREVAQAYVNEFLKILMGLEKGGRGGPRADNRRYIIEGYGGMMDDEEELRNWADVRQNMGEPSHVPGAESNSNGNGNVAPIAPIGKGGG